MRCQPILASQLLYCPLHRKGLIFAKRSDLPFEEDRMAMAMERGIDPRRTTPMEIRRMVS